MIIFFRGKAACGKTYTSKRLKSLLKVDLISKDIIFDDLFNNGFSWADANKLTYNKLASFIQDYHDRGQTLLVDIGLANTAYYDNFLSMMNIKDYKKFLFTCSDEQVWQDRIQKRIDKPEGPNQSFKSVQEARDHYDAYDIDAHEDEVIIDSCESIELIELRIKHHICPSIKGQLVNLKALTREASHEFFKSYEADEQMTYDTYTYKVQYVDDYFRQKSSDHKRLLYGIFRKDKIIGEIQLKYIKPGDHATLSVHLQNDQVKGLGYGTEAERLLIDHAFNELKLKKLLADTTSRNHRSQHILKKLGFRHLRDENDMTYFEMRRQMKLLYGTTNQGKINSMRSLLEDLGIEMISLNDLDGDLPDIPEDGQEPVDNARQKALAYYKTFGLPVFSFDSGLYFIDEPQLEQPGTYIRRYTGVEMDDQELINHFKVIARDNGGTIKAQYVNGLVLVMDEDTIYESQSPDLSFDAFYLTDKAHEKYVPGFPLNTISKEIESGKYFYDIEVRTEDSKRRIQATKDFFIDSLGLEV